MKLTFESTQRTFGVSAPSTIKPFVPITAKGKRVIIDRYVLEIAYALTPSTAALLGENIPNICANLIVNDAAGQRRNLPGRALRVANYYDRNDVAVVEHADLATGAERTGTFYLDVPFALEHSFEDGRDCAIPADLMGDLIFTWCGAAGLDYGSSTVAIGAATTLLVRAECHTEEGVGLYPRDLIKDEVMTNTTVSEHTANGKLDYMLGYKDGDELTDISGFTAAIIEPFQMVSVLSALQLRHYNADHGPNAISTKNPFTLSTPKAVVIWATRGRKPKIKDHPLVGDVILKATNTLADVRIISRTILPRNPRVDAQAMRRFGKTAVARGPLSKNNNAFIRTKVR